MEYLKEYLHIDYIIVLLTLVSGFFQARFIRLNLVKDKSLNSAYWTLIVSLVACSIYLFLIKPHKEMYALYFVSYFVATSLYELMVKPFVNWIKKTTGQKQDDI